MSSLVQSGRDPAGSMRTGGHAGRQMRQGRVGWWAATAISELVVKGSRWVVEMVAGAGGVWGGGDELVRVGDGESESVVSWGGGALGRRGGGGGARCQGGAGGTRGQRQERRRREGSGAGRRVGRGVRAATAVSGSRGDWEVGGGWVSFLLFAAGSGIREHPDRI